MKNIEYVNRVSPQDINALSNLNYLHLECDIDFKNILVKKPWGSEYLLFENEFCAIWILNINYMENTSMHSHPKKDTSLVCLDGNVSCNTLNSSYKLHELEGVFLSKKVFHQTQSISQDGSYILEIETPVNKFDLVRINDTYGRQGKEYEGVKEYSPTASLTLDAVNNSLKCINNTKIEILKISTLDALDKYDKNSIVALLDDSQESGKIVRLKDFTLNSLSKNKDIDVIIIYFIN